MWEIFCYGSQFDESRENTYWRETVCMFNMWKEIQHQGELESTSDYSYDKKALRDLATALKQLKGDSNPEDYYVLYERSL